MRGAGVALCCLCASLFGLRRAVGIAGCACGKEARRVGNRRPEQAVQTRGVGHEDRVLMRRDVASKSRPNAQGSFDRRGVASIDAASDLEGEL